MARTAGAGGGGGGGGGGECARTERVVVFAFVVGACAFADGTLVRVGRFAVVFVVAICALGGYDERVYIYADADAGSAHAAAVAVAVAVAVTVAAPVAARARGRRQRAGSSSSFTTSFSIA